MKNKKGNFFSLEGITIYPPDEEGDFLLIVDTNYESYYKFFKIKDAKAIINFLQKELCGKK